MTMRPRDVSMTTRVVCAIGAGAVFGTGFAARGSAINDARTQAHKEKRCMGGLLGNSSYGFRRSLDLADVKRISTASQIIRAMEFAS